MVGKERRFEDIDSGDEIGQDVPEFLNPINGNITKRPRQSPSRKPRSTYHETVGEGGFIFTVDSSSSSSSSIPVASSSSSSNSSRSHRKSVPGSKGQPTTRPQASVSPHDLREGKERNGSRHQSSSLHTSKLEPIEERQSSSSSSSHRAIRRSSLLKDGSSAIPHPLVPDDKLHRHCSGELVPQERMKHLTIWTLERSRKDMKRNQNSDMTFKVQASLLNALKNTLYDVNKGTLRIDWDSKEKGKGKLRDDNSSRVSKGEFSKLPPHPLNESNAKQESLLRSNVKELQKQDKARKIAEAEFDIYERETEEMRAKLGNIDATISDIWHDDWSPKDLERLKKAAKAIVSRQVEKRSSFAVDLTEEKEAAMRFFNEMESISTDVSQAGGEMDPRWNDVEFNVDLLRSRSHTLAQLSLLSQKYIAAVSARGANALKEMTEGSLRAASSSSGKGQSSASLASSTIARESRSNLEKILSSLRSIDDERNAEEDADMHLHTARLLHRHEIGDVSEGEILRAFAELS